MFLGSRPILVVPVPLSKKRFAKRGYNQAELLAQKMTARIPNGNIRVKTDLLKKIKETKPQVDIKKRSIRLSNLGDCFAITPQSASGGEVIVLLDDATLLIKGALASDARFGRNH